MKETLYIIGGIILGILVIGAFLQNQRFGQTVMSDFMSSWMENQGLRKYSLVLFTYASVYFSLLLGRKLWTDEPIFTLVFGLFYIFLCFGAFRKDTRRTRN